MFVCGPGVGQVVVSASGERKALAQIDLGWLALLPPPTGKTPAMVCAGEGASVPGVWKPEVNLETQ